MGINALKWGLVSLILLSSLGAFAQTTKHAESEYKKALASLERQNRSNSLKIDEASFGVKSWSGRIATINYLCSVNNAVKCKESLRLGLDDNALVVRDHALKVVRSSKLFSQTEKSKICDRVVADDRNYRGHRPLWIVERAKTCLESIKN